MLPYRTSWSAIRILMVIFICYSLVGTHCKPLQQQSNDRLLITDDRLPITDVYDSDSVNNVMIGDRSRNEPDVRLEKLTRTMNALAQFRRVINNRLLITNSLAHTNEDDQNENVDSRSRSLFLVDSEDGTVQNTPAPQRAQHRNHHRRKQQQRPPTSGVTAASFQRNQREDAESQSNTYTIRGFNIKAHLQPETPDAGAGQQQPDEQSQRFMTGGTTGIDEQQFQWFSDLAQSEFECPRLNGKTTQVLCPSRRRHGYRVCIPDTALCNEKLDCPNGEDEDPVNCLFYKTTIHHFRLVVDAVVELSDLVKQQQRRRGFDEL